MTVLAVRAALGNLCGLTLLGLSLVVAAASLSPLVAAGWSGRALWLVACGLAAYCISVGVVARTSARVDASAVREVRRVRDRLAGLLRSERLSGHAAAAAFVRTIHETVAQLDEEVMPALEQLAARHESVTANLARYANGELAAPDADVLERLRAVEERQRAAMAACVHQTVNAEAAVLAIINDNRDCDVVADDARTRTARLLDLHDALQEMLRVEG